MDELDKNRREVEMGTKRKMIKKLFSIPFPILTPIWILSSPIGSNISSYIFSHPTSPRKYLSYPLKIQNLHLVFVSSFPLFKNLPVLDCDNMVYVAISYPFIILTELGSLKWYKFKDGSWVFLLGNS